MNNYFEIKLKAISENERFARNVVAAFSVTLNPTLNEIKDIKTVISEAVTNCIVHAYNGDADKEILIKCNIEDNTLITTIIDDGVGIPDIELALTAFYTTREEEERSGMGFTLMQSFTDDLEVLSNENGGTTVIMKKKIKRNEAMDA